MPFTHLFSNYKRLLSRGSKKSCLKLNSQAASFLLYLAHLSHMSALSNLAGNSCLLLFAGDVPFIDRHHPSITRVLYSQERGRITSKASAKVDALVRLLPNGGWRRGSPSEIGELRQRGSCCHSIASFQAERTCVKVLKKIIEYGSAFLETCLPEGSTPSRRTPTTPSSPNHKILGRSWRNSAWPIELYFEGGFLCPIRGLQVRLSFQYYIIFRTKKNYLKILNW